MVGRRRQPDNPSWNWSPVARRRQPEQNKLKTKPNRTRFLKGCSGDPKAGVALV